jgi:hypothetical protein
MTRYVLRFTSAADPTWAGRTWPGTFTTRAQAETFLAQTPNRRHLEIVEIPHD